MATKNAGLGRGLGVLFGADAVRGAESGGTTLRITEIEPRSDQPRQQFDEDALLDLSESIKQHGILQPLAVRRLQSGYYQIIAGERRWRAARMAGLSEVPAIIFDADDRHATELALIENLQREDLNPIEEAEGFRMLIDEYGLTQEDVATRVGRSRPGVTNALRLLGLGDLLKSYLAKGLLTAGHARAVLQLTDVRKQEACAKEIVKEQLSVRQTEALVKRLLAENTEKPQKPPQPNYVGDHEKHLSSHFGRKVRIVAGAKRGRVELEFYSPEDLETLLSKLTQEQ